MTVTGPYLVLSAALGVSCALQDIRVDWEVLPLNQDKCMAIRLDNELIANRFDCCDQPLRLRLKTLGRKFVKQDTSSHSCT
jgi:hypothetical protein